MAKGSISIANGATAITGEGTTFTTELAAGDYIVFTAGQVVYTLAIKSVDSDTALTLTKAYTGPDADGLAWSAVPRSTMSQITMEVVNQVTEALRGLNHDKANWQQVFSESNDITVTLPDGSEFTGPSWSSVVNMLEDLDPDWLQQIVDDVTAAQASVSADKTAAESARDDAKAAANSAAAAQQAAEDAGASATQSASDAATSASAAADSATSASESAAESLKQAERAQELADSFDTTKVLKKDQNLADVSDVTAARKNLGLSPSDSVEFNLIKGNSDIYTRMISDDAVRAHALFSEIVGTDGELKARIELWCDTTNGNASIVNRNPTGARFFTIKQSGEVEPSGRVMSGYGAEFKNNGEVLTLRPTGANQATYMLIRDSDNSNIMLVGRSGASYDTVMTNYKYGTSITMTDAWAGCNKGWYGSTIESRSGYLNSKAISTTANAHLYFINSDNKNRGVIYSRPIANGQLICIRPDNSSTGATGSEMSVNGATGEVRAVKFTNISDERAKFWIKPVESALDKICQLRGVTYSMHTTVQNTVRNAGLIAQDVQKVLPEAITEYEADKTTIDKECRTIENPLSLDYNALSALYVEAFKEMRAEIDALKAELADMKAKAASLTASGDATISE
ncbi:tail fiber domain-containing protein [Cronobacter sakazakii]|uniref:tail fiber domain-containing protein n=1 Tax=Cronobacter sakazakii TaxID=28141 RepID=UPI000BE7A522|nr:tail fiber domain-containing protein [Cronobacter sakazakii]ELY6201164.1 tail fiber domain-containing protein [Cronobacter sakazakii]EMD7610636.1 tail fiber domain-containing protein [Cronobacter sakazakii]NCH92800.1 tail fiber domain-containing protein [Cronobacter sakazakii]NHV91954.1 tail fiber domain-containing protein [Cronobacter sakazakii]PQV65997.1 phage tail protein [Cronobacter sakazakii]